MEISIETKIQIIDYLILGNVRFQGDLDIVTFLKRIFDLSSMPSTDFRFNNAERDIEKHMIFNDDWDMTFLLHKRLDLPHQGDATFLKFLEMCVHPLVQKDQVTTAKLAREFNDFLSSDGFRLQISRIVNDKPIYKAVKLVNSLGEPSQDNYEIVLSYASENRDYVEAVADNLVRNGVHIFYDRYEEVTLWGKDLVDHLDKVYRRSARYCVMFVSKPYAEKIWTNHERKSALSRAVEEKGEYILPARFDNTELPGLRPSIKYVDLTNMKPETLAYMILQKLRSA